MTLKKTLLLTTITGLTLMACSVAGLPMGNQATALPEPTVNVMINTTTPEPADDVIEPTASPDADLLLPAQVYYISSTDTQLWRLERDGTTQTQITREPSPITGYDISPADGSIVYTSNNDLIHTDPLGENRVVLVDGNDIGTEFFENRINEEVTNPRWSPDGSLIAYGLAGINVMPADASESRMVLPSNGVPTLQENPQPHPQAKFYQPESWSPDGSKLLVRFLMWPEGINWGFVNIADGAFAEVHSAEPPGPCCYPHWNDDSQSVYFSNDVIGQVTSGLWLADAHTGMAQTLIQGNVNDQNFSLVRDAQLLDDGKLYFFYGTRQGFPEGMPVLQLYRADPDGVTNLEQVRDNDIAIAETIWDESGKGALVVQMPQNPNTWPIHGTVVWMPTSEGDLVYLPADGYYLQWGKAG